jgi:hypothetical protein
MQLESVRDTTTVINHHPINVPTLRVGATRLLRQRRHRSDQHRRQPRPRDPPRAGAARRRKPLSLELARQAIDTQIAKPLGLTVAPAAAAIYTVQNAQTGDLAWSMRSSRSSLFGTGGLPSSSPQHGGLIRSAAGGLVKPASS